MPQRNGQTDEILRKMARVRDALDGDFEGVAREARTLSNWHYYLRRYPLLSVAVAFGVGYFIVPRRLEITAPDEKTLAKLARNQKLVVEPRPARGAPRGPLAGVFNFLFSLSINGAMTYLGQYLAKALEAANRDDATAEADRSAAAGRQITPTANR